jgi:hypothetical protein
VLPTGFDEGDDRVLDLAGIGDRFLHQRGDDAERLAARQAMHRVASFRGSPSEPRLSMWSSSDASTYSSAPATSSRVSSSGRTHAVGDFVEHTTLFDDHAARHVQRQHAQRVADALEHFTLRGQLRRIAVLLAQEQIERFLDAQQIVLDGARYRIEQRTVVPGHRAAGVFQFAGIGQQAVQR